MRVVLKQTGQVDREFEAHEGQTIFSCLANQGVHIDAPCAGRGKCGKCVVKVNGSLSAPSEREIELLGSAEGRRLACQARVKGAAVIEIDAAVRLSSVKGLGESEPYDLDPPLKFMRLDLPDRQDGRVILSARNISHASIMALNDLAALDAERRPGWAVMWADDLLAAEAAEEGSNHGELLAAAVDLGTTGLAVTIIDMLRGEATAQGTALNPQTACGGDVISRITVASESAAELANLQSLALDGIGRLIMEIAGPKAGRIMASVISGNTTMIYLLAGVLPRGLAQAPYRPVFTRSLDLSHLAERLHLGRGAKILTTPCISAYVGGDITAGMLAVGLKKRPGVVLYIDIGTNGEIVLSHNGRLTATSCAAGPALEGMNIICGQRATSGAIDSFALAPDFSYNFTTIAGAPATGICGSGLIDLTAALVEHGFIDKTGRLKAPGNLPAASPWRNDLSGGRLNLTADVFYDQKDVRQVQLAKGAIAAAVEMLLARMGLSEADLDEIIIAGAFGFHLKPESLKAISLIPPAYEGPVRFVGNSSLAGAARMLLNAGALEELNAIAEATEVLELGFDPQFQNIFVKHLKFPD
ncbi:MAG: ASKHA domain-containing protein [Candidatus Adiutrix sp.]|jgi:uncharacterized 2Fe-2S/4Fe-4S cluster protein (DUF4445 family)|nr:ASKHA domain-containing protein [Candidatus Adiutrix sp.]